MQEEQYEVGQPIWWHHSINSVYPALILNLDDELTVKIKYFFMKIWRKKYVSLDSISPRDTDYSEEIYNIRKEQFQNTPFKFELP